MFGFFFLNVDESLINRPSCDEFLKFCLEREVGKFRGGRVVMWRLIPFAILCYIWKEMNEMIFLDVKSS